MAKHSESSASLRTICIAWLIGFGCVWILLAGLANLLALLAPALGLRTTIEDLYRDEARLVWLAYVLLTVFSAMAGTAVAMLVALGLWVRGDKDAKHAASLTPPGGGEGKPSAKVLKLDGVTHHSGAVWPAHDLLPLVAVAAGGWFYLVQPSWVYRHWQWFELVPMGLALLLFFGGALLARRRARHPHSLTDAGWRLRVCLGVIAIAVVSKVAIEYRRATSECTRESMRSLVEARNSKGLQSFLSRRESCGGAELDAVFQEVLLYGLTSADDHSLESPKDEELILGVLLSRGAKVSRMGWETLFRETESARLDRVLSILPRVAQGAQWYSAQELGVPLVQLVESGRLSALNKLIAAGVRLDADSWSPFAFRMFSGALTGDPPSLALYDALLGAGLRPLSKFSAIVDAIRSGSPDPVRNWSVDDWWGPVEADADVAVPWLAQALLSTDQPALRAAFLSLAGTTGRDVVERMPVPARCLLSKPLGRDRVHESVSRLADQHPWKSRCLRLLEQSQERD